MRDDLHSIERGAEALDRAIRGAVTGGVSSGQATFRNASAANEAALWPDPKPIQAPLYPVPSFDALALLPEPLRTWVMDEAERMPCAPEFVAAGTLVGLGSVIGARCAIKPKAKDSWLVVPNLWGGVVALPSSKKSPAIDAAMRPLDRLAAKAKEEHQQAFEAFESDALVFKARKDAIEDEIKKEAKKPNGGNADIRADELRRFKAQSPEPPKLRRFRTNDATVEKLGEMLRDNPAGILALRDELVGMLASWDREGREGDRAFFLEAWNGTGSFDTDRIGRGSISIPNLCVSVFGGIQPDKLTEYLEQAAHALSNDGTLQRFQMLVYPDPRRWEWRDLSPNREARDAVFAIFERLATFEAEAWGATIEDARFPYFRFSDEAQTVFIEWMHDLQVIRIPTELASGSQLMAQHLAKYEKLFAALALIFHLSDCAAHQVRGPVSVDAAVRAAAWCEFLEAHARRCYGLLADEGLRAAQALASRIERGTLQHGFTARDVRRNGWRYLTTDASVRMALEWLEDEGWIRALPIPLGPGRHTDRYAINPIFRKAPQ